MPSTQFFQRTSAVRAAEVAGLDYAREHFNAGAPIELTETRIVLDEYFEPDDGGASTSSRSTRTAATSTSCVAQKRSSATEACLGWPSRRSSTGRSRSDANLFSNVDQYLRGLGFGLFDLEVYRYSRSALPAEFALDVPAQTVTGQISWGEAIYFRDLGDPDYESTWGFEPSATDVHKLMCLFEIFGLPDCSAELVLKYGARLGGEQTRSEYLRHPGFRAEGRAHDVRRAAPRLRSRSTSPLLAELCRMRPDISHALLDGRTPAATVRNQARVRRERRAPRLRWIRMLVASERPRTSDSRKSEAPAGRHGTRPARTARRSTAACTSPRVFGSQSRCWASGSQDTCS